MSRYSRLANFDHPVPLPDLRGARRVECPFSRRELILGFGGVMLVTGLAPLTPARAGDTMSGTYTSDDEDALVSGYWKGLTPGATSTSILDQFGKDAITAASALGAGRPVLDTFLGFADAAVKTLGTIVKCACPAVYYGVQICVSALGAALGGGQRFLAPMMTNTKGYQVLDATYKAMNWLTTAWGGRTQRQRDASQNVLIPADEAHTMDWQVAGVPVEGLSHATRGGALFVSKNVFTDQYQGTSGRYVGVQQGSEKPTMFILDGLG